MTARAALVVLVLASCGGRDDAARPLTFGGDRPTQLRAPAKLTEGKRYPLYLVLHGYEGTGFWQTTHMSMNYIPDTHDVLLLAPDGTTDRKGNKFWNADAACCDFDGRKPDDAAYLGGLLEDVISKWPVDPARVYVIGFSNGGFMAHRLACERADLVTAIASVAGHASSTPGACKPAREVHVLQIHGTADEYVSYTATAGGIGAEASVMQWATSNRCGSARTEGGPFDLESRVPGTETHSHAISGCPANGAVELWEMRGARHMPTWTPEFLPTLLGWFADHRRS
ncbi:MAG: hypothetical protein H0T42_34105 [Deltaproteobacteria bacterium]|nr:hypothetical protein [Deltaproteobacteria bacterium]